MFLIFKYLNIHYKFKKTDYNCNMEKRLLTFNRIYKDIKNTLNIPDSTLSVIFKCNPSLISLFNSNKRNITYDKAILLQNELIKREEDFNAYLFKWNDKALYHGSMEGIVGDISLSNCKKRSADFGLGFYVGESFKQSSTFICGSRSNNRRVYSLTVNFNNLKILDLTPKNIDDFRWVLSIANNRKFLLEDKYKSLVNSLDKLFNGYDVIFGPIADDRMTYCMDRFLMNEITDSQLYECLTRLKLGNQYCFKNDDAMKRINIVEEIEIDDTTNELIKTYQKNQHMLVIEFTNRLLRSRPKKGRYFIEILKKLEKNKWKL